METPTFLFLVFLITNTPAGKGADAENITIYRAVGSSVVFPAVNITTDNFYDFKKGDQLVYTCHGPGIVRWPYGQRGHFDSKSGTFELRNLTEDDSGTYEQWVDMKRVAVINLHVIEPLKEPTLRMFETKHGDQNSIDLECSVQGPDLLSMIFLKDGEEITENITGMGHTRNVTMDACDPGSPGIYTCVVANPLGNKTSQRVNVTQDCKKDPEDWRIIFIIVFIIFTIICIIAAVTKCLFCFFVGKSQEENKKKLRRCCGCEDLESGRTSEETLESSANENPPGEEQRGQSYHLLPLNDPKDDVKVDTDRRLSTEETLGSSANENPPGEEQRGQSYHPLSMDDPKDNVKMDTDRRLSTEEESLQHQVPGQCGQDGKPTKELDMNGTASYHGEEANG